MDSPYAFSENRVIDGVELEGAEVYFGTHSNQIEYESIEAREKDLEEARIEGGINVFKGIWNYTKERFEKPTLVLVDINNVTLLTTGILSGKINIIDVGERIYNDRKARIQNSGDPEREMNIIIGEDVTNVTLGILSDKGFHLISKVKQLGKLVKLEDIIPNQSKKSLSDFENCSICTTEASEVMGAGSSSSSKIYNYVNDEFGETLSPNALKEFSNTLERIKNKSAKYSNDATEFQNNWRMGPESQRLDTGVAVYEEWTVKTPGTGNNGARRIVIDRKNKKAYYTHDHYESFIEIEFPD